MCYRAPHQPIHMYFGPASIHLAVAHLERPEATAVHLVTQLLGRFRQTEFVVLDFGCLSEMRRAWGGLRAAQGFHVFFRPWSEHNSSELGTAYVCRRLRPPKRITGVLHPCCVALSPYEVHAHRQTFSQDAKHIYVTLDPPYFGPASHGSYRNLHMGLTSPVAALGRVDRMRPRWDRLHRLAAWEGKWKDGTVLNDGRDLCFHLRRKLVIPKAPGRADRELGAFQRYATACLQHFDAQATVIQRAWRRAISDPSYLLCRRRLLNEWACLEQG